jgi:hypothetical protein
MPTRKAASSSRSATSTSARSAAPTAQTAKAEVRKAAASAAPVAPAKAAGKRAAAAAKTAKKPPVAPKTPKPKAKLVRDSFTMPQADFALVGVLKERALEFKRPTKKSELLRAGLQALAKLDAAALSAALGALTPLKPGRPKQGD